MVIVLIALVGDKMLVDIPDYAFGMGVSPSSFIEKIDTGFYYADNNLIVFFNREFEKKIDEYPTTKFIFNNDTNYEYLKDIPPSYGLCDTVNQFIERYKKFLSESEEKYFITFRPINKKYSPSFRFHKNGTYIGDVEINSEYLGDQEGMEELFSFNVYKIMNDGEKETLETLRSQFRR
jgi:hypothetical protein